MSHTYETVIGLETHVQLGTASKAFCADSAAFGSAPNTQTSVISLAHPGTLPRLNRRAVEYAVRLGLALGCRINPRTTFDRKNYFYADSPKGFQTTQDRSPICIGGNVDIGRWTLDLGFGTLDVGQQTLDSGATSNVQPPKSNVPNPTSQIQRPTSQIRIHHIHLEEDAGKSIHDQDPTESLIDLNRAGVPLLEIVSEPDFRTADEVAAYMEELRRLVRWLGISDGNMEEGSLRCDVNISVRRVGETIFGNRCEVKNMNSMRFAKRAIEHEVARQIQIIESGGTVVQETRGFNVATGTTFSLREKENAHDYRYFPEPDLPPVVLSEDFLEQVKSGMPPLPQALERSFQTEYGLSAYDAAMLTQERETAFYFLKLAGTPERRSGKVVSDHPEQSSGVQTNPEQSSGVPDHPERSSGVQTNPEQSSRVPDQPEQSSGVQTNPELRSRVSDHPEQSSGVLYKPLANLLINKLLPWSASTGTALEDCPVSSAHWIEFLQLIESGQVSSSTAYQRLFPILLEKSADQESPSSVLHAPLKLAIELNLLQTADTGALETWVDEVLARMPDKVAEYRKGKKGLLGLFMGEVMRTSKGKADPQATTKLLQDKLTN